MKMWVYCFVTTAYAKLSETLSEKGREGWEAVAVEWEFTQITSRILFKKEVSDPPADQEKRLAREQGIPDMGGG